MQLVRVFKPGGLKRLELVKQPLAALGSGQVRIETSAIGVNYADCIVRMGLYNSAKKYVGWPITPGFEFCGNVAAVGREVEGFHLGQRVLGLTRFGGYASELLVEPSQLYPAPESWSDAEVGGFGVVFLTAWYALCELCRLRPGMRILIHSAAGGVGQAATQLATLHGAEVVGVVGGEHKRSAATAAGAREVIDRSQENWTKRARDICPDGYDVILDPNGGRTLRHSYLLLCSTGRLIVYGAQGLMSRGQDRPNYLRLVLGYLRTPSFHPLDMIDRNVSVCAFNLSYLFERQELLREALDKLLYWANAGKISPLPVRTFPLSDVAQAHSALESGSTVGKLILVP